MTKKQFSDGHYVGDMKGSLRHGVGKYIWDSGPNKDEVYEGDWKDDQITGKGIYTWQNGGKYEGVLKDSRMTGKGIYTWPDGQKYDGDWKDSRMTGKGIYTDPKMGIDGSKYEGEWKDGQIQGHGVYTIHSKSTEAKWNTGIADGIGIHTRPNGDRFEGEIYINWHSRFWPSKIITKWEDGFYILDNEIYVIKDGLGLVNVGITDYSWVKHLASMDEFIKSRPQWMRDLAKPNAAERAANRFARRRLSSLPYAHISINSPIKDIQEVAEAEGRTVQEIYEDLMDDGVINKSNVEKGPVMTQQLNEEFEELVEITVSNAHTYEDWMELGANGQRMQEGAIADVWRIKSDQGNLFIKTAYDEKGKKVLLKEIATLEELMEENLGSTHPHIFFQSKDEDKPLLVMTQVGERSLETDYDNLDTEQGMNFLYDLALDIQRLHEQGHYIHRDLKPGNIAINDTKSGNSIYAGLIDFGSARKNMRKQGDGDRFISEPWTHPSQREIGVRVRPGQDWYSFTWIAMCVIMGAKYDKIQAMIEGGSFETKFKNKIANIDPMKGHRQDFDLVNLGELIKLVTKFGEIPDLEKLEDLAEIIFSNLL